jgi:hypothetical protein
MQLRARTAFWTRHRNDPMVDPSHMTGAELARQLDVPSMEKWWRDPSFRSWFLLKESWREEAEFSLNLLLAELSARLRRGRVELEATKDLIGLTKVLGELAGKMGRAADAAVERAKLSEAEARKLFDQTARQLGYVLPDSHTSDSPAPAALDAPKSEDAE